MNFDRADSAREKKPNGPPEAAGLVNRRAFVIRAVGALAVGVAIDRIEGQSTTAQPQVGNASNLGAMDQNAAQSVRRPAKPAAHPSMTDAQRDELEHHIRCQCGCTLDVYTCRTTDFSCEVSPAMHADIKSLVEGGYSAQEILDSFIDTYGERALMAPRAQGFNLLGYVAPFVALGAGAIAVAVVLRGWGHREHAVVTAPQIQGTPDELARLAAAIRDDA
jgi:cytochrome c-type biogenesis protein CcmH